MPVRRGWTRPNIEDHLWAAGPYRRSDRGKPSGPERTIEDQILGAATHVAEGRLCLDGHVIDAIKAIPLTRRPKIEADVLLLVDRGDAVRQYLAEVKGAANNPWYAAIELLRQMRLFAASHTVDYFHHKNPKLPPRLSVTGLVLAPEIYYKTATGWLIPRSSSTTSSATSDSTFASQSGTDTTHRSPSSSGQPHEPSAHRALLDQCGLRLRCRRDRGRAGRSGAGDRIVASHPSGRM